MRSLTVVEKIDHSFSWVYRDHLYNHSDFQTINNDLPRKSFYLVDKDRHEIHGHLTVEFLEGICTSHISAPFGGITFSEQINDEDRLFFAIEIKRKLLGENINELLLHQPPKLNDRDFRFEESLGYTGYDLTREREYQMIALDGDFEKELHEMEKRKLNKSLEQGFRFEVVEPSRLREVLDFVVEQRSILGYEFSMNWDQLKQYQKAFPDHYFGVKVLDGDKLIAASILVKETSDMLYQFAPAHIKSYNKFSPVVFMTAQICSWAKALGYSWLNLGTSYLEEQKNEGLYSFKEKLGASVFVASSLQKIINS